MAAGCQETPRLLHSRPHQALRTQDTNIANSRNADPMDEITLKNFRCFREEQTARLAPLTLLVGDNSTGKTSFMAAIRALWDIAYAHRVPDFKEEPYDLGSFDEIAHHRGKGGGRADRFEIGFLKRNTEKPVMFKTWFEKRGAAPIPIKRRLSDIEEKCWLDYLLDQDRSWQILFGTPKGSWRTKAPIEHVLFTDDQVEPFDFLVYFIRGRRNKAELKSLKGQAKPSAADWNALQKICETPFPYFSEKRLHASAPVRSKPHRTYDPARPLRDPEGDYIPMYLANIFFRDKKQWDSLKNALEDFGKSAGLFDEISVKSFGRVESEPFQIQIRKFGNHLKGPQRNLIDVGYGVSQILPVITELLRDDAPPIFLLQQPEIHLHPSAQAALGSLFSRLANPERQLVVETHSDHLLDRIRMDIRDGETELKPEDVSVLFFERQEIDVRIHSLTLDELGNVNGTPPGYRQFFMSEMRRSLKL